MANTQPRISYESFKIFQLLGYFLGGLLPVGIFLVLELTLDQNILSKSCEIAFIILGILGFVIGNLAFLLFDRKEHEDNKWFGIFFLIQAIFSFILIHLLVLYTGGPKSSVFAVSYLYLIAVVGYCFGPKKELYGAAALLSLSYFINLFFQDPQQYLFDLILVSKKTLKDTATTSFNDTIDGKIIYLAVFIIQLFATYHIAKKQYREP